MAAAGNWLKLDASVQQRQPHDTETLEVDSLARALGTRGWVTMPPVLDAATIAQLRATVAPFARAGRGGARNLLDLREIQALATSKLARGLASCVLGDHCFAMRALLFDKTPDANWKVIWHQDLTIAARERVEVAGYGPWTEKGGVPHVQPPVSILENMLAIRFHLDPCGLENGPVRVLDGTHELGRLSSGAIDALRRELRETDCLVEEGGVLMFRPLLLHASAPATAPHHRRVIHIEFAASELVAPLEWHRRVA